MVLLKMIIYLEHCLSDTVVNLTDTNTFNNNQDKLWKDQEMVLNHKASGNRSAIREFKFVNKLMFEQV